MKRKKVKDLTPEEREELIKPLLPAMNGIEQMLNSPAIKSMTQLLNSPAMKSMTQLLNSPAMKGMTQFVNSPAMKRIAQFDLRLLIDADNNAEKFFEEMRGEGFKEFVNMPPVDRRTILAIIDKVTDPESPYAQRVKNFIDEETTKIKKEIEESLPSAMGRSGGSRKSENQYAKKKAAVFDEWEKYQNDSTLYKGKLDFDEKVANQLFITKRTVAKWRTNEFQTGTYQP